MRDLKRFVLCAAAATVLVPALALGAGFALYENSARAVGMAGAFGATADEPSAAYYNPAGLAFLDGFQIQGGFFLIKETSKFYGANPYPGEGYTVKMENQIFFPLHLFATGPLAENLRWGVAVYSPFGLGTWWPDEYAGKFLSKRVDLKLFNVNPNLAYKLSDNFAVAVGFDYYLSKLSLTKSLPYMNPYTQTVAEIGQVHLFTDDFKTGTGWNAGFLAKLGAGFSLAATYRSEVKIKYDGARASFIQFPTGYADFDAIIAGALPFGEKVTGETEIKYPKEVRYALAWHNDRWTIEGDMVRVGWKSFQRLPITLYDYPQLSSVAEEGYKDANTYRLGAEYRSSDRWAWQLGVLKDETPQPAFSVSPLLPDADRWGYSVGVAWNVSPQLRLEASWLHLPFKDRSTEGENLDNYNGEYKTTADLVGFGLVYKF
jgi:long-chain fatty acid transport protein